MKKDLLKVGIIGHRHLKKEASFYANEIKKIFNLLKKEHSLQLLSSVAIGSDTIASKVALHDNIPLISVIPFTLERYKNDFNDKELEELDYLIGKSHKIIELNGNDYEIAADYLINCCDIIIFIYNGVELPLINDKHEPINRGGTYHTLLKVKKLNKTHIIIND